MCVRKTINNIIISLNKVNSMLLLHTPYKENFLRFFRFLLTVPIQLYKYFILVTVKQAFFWQAREFRRVSWPCKRIEKQLCKSEDFAICQLLCNELSCACEHAPAHLQVHDGMHDGLNFMQIHFFSFNPCLVLKPDLFSS